ncbi:MAG: hypothetical protein QXL58_02885 [Candidatus Hadarchaeales archaeon]
MKERGQVLTLDMFLALSLTALLLGYSGLVMEHVQTRAREEISRYSLERMANDAVEALVKTKGLPENWEDQPSSLQVPGLADKPNLLNLRKLVYLRELCRRENWTSSRPEIKAVERFFGGQNFEVRVLYRHLLLRAKVAGLNSTLNTIIQGVKVYSRLENLGAQLRVRVRLEKNNLVKEQVAQGKTFSMVVSLYPLTVEVVSDGKTVGVWCEGVIWDFWPGWDLGGKPGAENSVEVTVAKRFLVLPAGELRNAVENRRHHARPDPYTLPFLVRPGELDFFDWYVVLSPSSPNKPVTDVWVNRSSGNPDYHFPWDTLFAIRSHGQDYSKVPLTETENGGNPNNYLILKVTGNPAEYVDVAIVAVPRCSPQELCIQAGTLLSGILEVRIWR